MLKRCPFNKLRYFLNFLPTSFNCFSASSNYPIKNVQTYKQISVKKIPFEWQKCVKFVGNLMISTSIWYETNKDDIEENLAHLITLAKIALERGDVDRAKDILNLGLQLSEDHKHYSAIPYLYDIIIAIAISQGNNILAQDLLVTAIEKLKMWGFSDEQYNVIDFKLRLARIYSANGQQSLATIGFENCVNQQKNKILNGDTSEKTGILYINVLFWYGIHMIRNGQYNEARDMIRTAYEYSTKMKGLSPKQEMIILYTLADLNLELGDLDIALQTMLNATVIGKGIGSVDMPVCYLKLGNIYEKLGYFKQAVSSYKQALKTAKLYGYFDIVSDAEDALTDLKDYDK